MTHHDDVWYLTVRLGVSTSAKTRGQTTCSLRHTWGGSRLAFCRGGHYCKIARVFSDWIEQEFYDELKVLDPRDYLGLSIRSGVPCIDARCGTIEVFRIIHGLGYEITCTRDKDTEKDYTVRKVNRDTNDK